MTTMEAINDSSKLIAQAIEVLKKTNDGTIEIAHAAWIDGAIELLKTALDKLVVEI